MGNIFGGQVLAYIDEVAGIAAMRHSGRPVVTASIDSVDFLLPVREGDIMTVDAFVVWTGRTSMEVYIQVTTEKGPGGPPQLTTTSFVTAVAVGDGWKTCPRPTGIASDEGGTASLRNGSGTAAISKRRGKPDPGVGFLQRNPI